MLTVQVHGSADTFDPCAQSISSLGRPAGPAAGAGGPVAAAVGAACSVLQRAEHPQPETDGVELPSILPAEVTSSSIDALTHTVSETLHKY